MDIPTVPGSIYTVATKTTCDITDTATGTPIDSASAGSVTFTAQGLVTTLSDPDATYSKVNFKTAAAALRLLGGGDQLPNGFLAAEFLESTGSQYIKTEFIPDNNSGISYKTETNSSVDFIGIGCRNSINTDTRLYAPRGNTRNYYGYGWGSWRTFYGTSGGFKTRAELNYKNSRIASIDRASATLETLSFTPLFPLYIFAANIAGSASNKAFCKIWYISLTQGDNVVCDFIPALDKTGTPCLFDKVSKQPFYNDGEGAFIVGLSIYQARKLGKLPVGGGSLKISLPENYTDDEAVVEALSTATENGWIFEIQTYTTDGAEASTFSLRRIWVRKTADPDGAYVAATGERWHVEWCQTVLGAETSDLGYEPFRSVDVALAEWELTPYIFPEEETLSI